MTNRRLLFFVSLVVSSHVQCGTPLPLSGDEDFHSHELLKHQVVNSGDQKWYCDRALLSRSQQTNQDYDINIPVSRHFTLTAEPKSGTTWIAVVVTQLVADICNAYDSSIEGVTCRIACDSNTTADVLDVSSYSKCRTLSMHFRDYRKSLAKTHTSGSRSFGRDVVDFEKSSVHIYTHRKHQIPFLSAIEGVGHANDTPMAHLPHWLQKCVLDRNYHCIPPGYALKKQSNVAEKVQDDIQKVIEDFIKTGNTTVCKSCKKTASNAYFNIIRDPRSVVVSAAHYAAGLKVYGSKQKVNVNEFAVDFIDATSAWTQFRYHWLKNVIGAAVPVHQVFYAPLKQHPATEIAKLAAFFWHVLHKGNC